MAFGHRLSDEQYAAIGRLSVEFNRIEARIENLLLHVLQVEEHVSRVIAQCAGDTFSRKVGFLKTLLNAYAKHYPEFRAAAQRFSDLLDQGGDLANERNKLIHGRFTYSEVTRDYELRSKNDWIASDAAGIGKLISDLHGLMSQIDSEATSLVKMVQHRRTESTFKGFGVL